MKSVCIAILSLILLTGCAGEDTAETGNESLDGSTASGNEQDALEDEVQQSLEGLVLNAGTKWQVDVSTDEGMKAIQELVNNYDGENVKQLGKDIKSTLKDITKSCNMTGEDHNQYHILLSAMMEEAKLLKKEKSTDPSKMQRYLDAYDAHFEVGETE